MNNESKTFMGRRAESKEREETTPTKLNNSNVERGAVGSLSRPPEGAATDNTPNNGIKSKQKNEAKKQETREEKKATRRMKMKGNQTTTVISLETTAEGWVASDLDRFSPLLVGTVPCKIVSCLLPAFVNHGFSATVATPPFPHSFEHHPQRTHGDVCSAIHRFFTSTPSTVCLLRGPPGSTCLPFVLQRSTPWPLLQFFKHQQGLYHRPLGCSKHVFVRGVEQKA